MAMESLTVMVMVIIILCRKKVSAIDIIIQFYKLNDENYPVVKISNSILVYQLPQSNKLN